MTALTEARPSSGVPPASPPASPPTYTTVVLRTVEELKAHVAAWDNLARHAAEPNAFYEAWALLPALQRFAKGEDLVFVLLYLPINAQRRQPLLCGFFPLARRRLHRLVPVTYLDLWQHDYCFLCTPLLRTGHGPEVVEAFFDFLRTHPLGAALWRLDLVSADGAFASALTNVCYRLQRPSFQVEAYCRARLETRADPLAYMIEALSNRRLKEFTRKERLLGERGTFERRVLGPGDDVAAWADQFLQLEAGGWKGRSGTAMANDPTHAAYFRELVAGAYAQGRLLMLGLFLDGRPVALKCNLLAGVGSFAFKIAFDEAFAFYSPGVILELANIQHLHDSGCARWMDSCAMPQHFMINRLWLERRAIVSRYVATGRAPGDLLVSAMPLGRWLKRTVRPPKPIDTPKEDS